MIIALFAICQMAFICNRRRSRRGPSFNFLCEMRFLKYLWVSTIMG